LLTTQFALWTACALAVFGICWRSVPFDLRILFFGFVVAVLAVAELVWWKRPKDTGSRLSPKGGPEEFVEEEEEFDASATQQIVRSRIEDGTERLEGTFLVEFAPEQRTASVHVPFCPAFETEPMVEALLLDGDATLSVVKPRSFGVRIDVKRRDDEPVRILVVAAG
jgi:hypothetical protein